MILPILTPFVLLVAQTGFPFTGETLNYTVNWPSGLSLGEGRFRATHGADRWDFELTLEAAVPGFAVTDRYHSVVSEDLCSLELEKESAHGKKKTQERSVFDLRKGTAQRTTANGGKTEFSIPACPRDALAFLYYTRRELGQGRVPPAQAVFFGASYQVRLEYTGAQVVAVNEKRMEADRVVASFKGPASDLNFEIFFARDPARTPVVIRAPFALGTFSMELVR
jgi:hypothetical protein